MVDEKELNVFKTLFNNSLFWFILIAELVVQNYMVWAAASPLGSALIGTAVLSMN